MPKETAIICQKNGQICIDMSEVLCSYTSWVGEKQIRLTLASFQGHRRSKNVENCLVCTHPPEQMDGFCKPAQIYYWEIQKNRLENGPIFKVTGDQRILKILASLLKG